MKFNNYDLCLITDEKQRLYLLGFNSTDGYVVYTKNKIILVIDKRYFYAAKKTLEPKGFDVVCGSDFSYLAEVFVSSGAKTLGIDFSVTTLAQKATLEKLLSGVTFVDIGAELEYQAAIKNQQELKSIQKACKIAEKSFLETLSVLKEGVTESQVAAQLEYAFKMNGASDKSFDTIIAFGANSAVPHHQTGKTRLKYGMPVLMDFGCIYNGYCSDMTRTMFFGEPTEEFKKVYKAVYQAHMAAHDNIKGGMTGKEADATARDVLEECGYGKYFTHSLGHGIGVHIHEYPYLAPRRTNYLEDGMVFSNEPGVYLDGKFGVRIEDSCYMQGGKVYSFMKEDKRLIVINNGKISKVVL